jgi:hypothetical protein
LSAGQLPAPSTRSKIPSAAAALSEKQSEVYEAFEPIVEIEFGAAT